LKSFTLPLIILSTLLSFSLRAQLADMTCSMEYTPNIPMMVSDATDMGKREYENFRESMIPKEDNVSHFISKRSIVRVLRPASRGEDYLNVEVLGEAKINEARAKGYFEENAHNKKLPQAKKGQKGFIHRNSLKPSDDFIFVVAKDSAFVALPSPYDTAKAFRVSKSGKNYKVNRCCQELQENQKEKTCFDYPVFEVKLDGNWKTIEDDIINAKVYCGVSTETRPIEKDQYQAILGILKYPSLGLEAGFLPEDRTEANANDLYFVDSRGLVMLPHVIADRGVDLTQGPYGSYHFTGGGQDIKGDDAYLAPYAACGFMAVMREWNRRYPDCAGRGCGITWGNCSHSTHIAGVKGRWPSKTHGHGHCIDIRLFSKTRYTTNSNVYSNTYNRNRVVEFLQLARAAGASTIYLEDAKAARMVHKQKGSGLATVLTRVPPHKDHMHVCFSHRASDSRSSFADPYAPATNSRLKNVCSQDSNDSVAGLPSKLLSTDVVATAGVKTPEHTLPLVGPIPRPRPRPENLVAEAETEAQRAPEQESVVESEAEKPAVETVTKESENNILTVIPRPKARPKVAIIEPEPLIEVEPVVTPVATPKAAATQAIVASNDELPVETPVATPTAAPTKAIVASNDELPVETPVATPTAAPTQAIVTNNDQRLNEPVVITLDDVSVDTPTESAVAVIEEEVPTKEATPIPIPEDRPMVQEPVVEIVEQPENDPFAEDTEPLSISDMIHEETRQDQLSELEKEKYYGEELTELEPAEGSLEIVEGDYVDTSNKPVPIIIEPVTQSEQDRGPTLQSESDSSEPEIVYDNGDGGDYGPSVSGPQRRFNNGRKPTGNARADNRDEFQQAVDGAYQPVTTPEDTNPGFFASFFSGIWQFLASIFSFLG